MISKTKDSIILKDASCTRIPVQMILKQNSSTMGVNNSVVTSFANRGMYEKACEVGVDRNLTEALAKQNTSTIMKEKSTNTQKRQFLNNVYM